MEQTGVFMKALVFARLRELLGAGEIDFPFEEGLTAGGLRERLAVIHPEAAGVLAKSLVALNNEYVGDESPIRATDAVALIPPVSGG